MHDMRTFNAVGTQSLCSMNHTMQVTLPFFLPRPRRAAPPLGGSGCVSGAGALLGNPATAKPREEGRRILGDPAGLGLPAAADALVRPSSCSFGSAFIVMDTYLQHADVNE